MSAGILGGGRRRRGKGREGREGRERERRDGDGVDCSVQVQYKQLDAENFECSRPSVRRRTNSQHGVPRARPISLLLDNLHQGVVDSTIH